MSGHLRGREIESLSANCREVCTSPDELEKAKQMFLTTIYGGSDGQR